MNFVEYFGFEVLGLGDLNILGLRFWDLGIRVQGLGLLGLWVWVFGLRGGGERGYGHIAL